MKTTYAAENSNTLTHEDIDRYLAEAHAMRAEAMNDMLDAVVNFFSRVFDGPMKERKDAPATRVHGTIVGAS